MSYPNALDPEWGYTLSKDEKQVLALIDQRMRKGRRTYGALRIDGDPREFLTEALEEALDLAVYLGIKLVQLKQATGLGRSQKESSHVHGS